MQQHDPTIQFFIEQQLRRKALIERIALYFVSVLLFLVGGILLQNLTFSMLGPLIWLPWIILWVFLILGAEYWRAGHTLKQVMHYAEQQQAPIIPAPVVREVPPSPSSSSPYTGETIEGELIQVQHLR